MTYDEYVKMNGKLQEAEFNELLPFIVANIESLIAEYVPKWRLEDDLESYDLDNINYILRMQIDFIASSGGINALMGKSDFDITSVTTSGITMQIGSSSQITYHEGVPISPLVRSILVKELRKKGYLQYAVW